MYPHYETTPSTSLATTQRAAAPREVFPGLAELVKEVELALGERETGAVVRRLQERIGHLLSERQQRLPAELLRVDPRGYRRVELHYCPLQGFQILAMVWGPGQGTPVHDHRELWGIEAVCQGELEVVDFSIADVAGELLRLQPVATHRVVTGNVLGFGPESGLHLCRNSSTRLTTVSLHVYAKPLDRFGIFLDEGDGWCRREEIDAPIER